MVLVGVLNDQLNQVLDQKWSEHFSRLEAMLLARSREKTQPELTFKTVIYSDEASTIWCSEVGRTFIQPAQSGN